jgi:hypothetical protein
VSGRTTSARRARARRSPGCEDRARIPLARLARVTPLRPPRPSRSPPASVPRPTLSHPPLVRPARIRHARRHTTLVLVLIGARYLITIVVAPQAWWVPAISPSPGLHKSPPSAARLRLARDPACWCLSVADIVNYDIAIGAAEGWVMLGIDGKLGGVMTQGRTRKGRT